MHIRVNKSIHKHTFLYKVTSLTTSLTFMIQLFYLFLTFADLCEWGTFQKC